jgi:hypothetical protein
MLIFLKVRRFMLRRVLSAKGKKQRAEGSGGVKKK